MTTTAELDIKVESQGVAKADTRLKGLGATAEKTSKSTRKFSQSQKKATASGAAFQKQIQATNRGLAGATGSLLAFGAAAGAIRLAADFSEATATVKALAKAANVADESIAALSVQARELGASTRFSATQATKAQVALLRAGLSVNEVFASSASTLDLATAALLGLDRAAEITAITMAQFGLDASQATRIGDVLVTTANNATTDVEQLAQAMKFAGPIAAGLGKSLEETAGALGVLSNAGLQASLAGTGFRGVVSSLARPTERGTKRIQALAKASGQLVDEFDITIKSTEEVFRAFKKAEAGPKDILQIFGRLQAPAALALTEGVSALGEFSEKLDNAKGASEDFANILQDTLKGDLLNLKSAIEEVILSSDEGLGPSFRELIQFTTEVVRALSTSEEQAMKLSRAARILAAMIKVVVTAFLAWKAINIALAIGTAVQAMWGLVAAVGALRVAIASTGIGLLAVVLGTAAVAAAEAGGLFDTASDSLDDAKAAADAQAEANKALEESGRASKAASRAQHDARIAEVNELADREEKAEADKKKRAQAAKARGRAAAKRAASAVDSVNKITEALRERTQVAGLGKEEQQARSLSAKLEQLFATTQRLKLKPGESVFDALFSSKDAEKAERAAVQFGKILKANLGLLEEAQAAERAAAIEDAAIKANFRVAESLDDVRQQIKALQTEAADRTMVDLMIEFAAELRAAKQFGLDLTDELKELASARGLRNLIQTGQELVMTMDDLREAGDFSAEGFKTFEDAATAAMENYRGQLRAGVGSAQELQASIAGIEAAIVEFGQNVARAEVLGNVSDVVQSITRSFFDLFETIVDGSATAKEALVDFLKAISQALFQKFVVEATINAISSAFSAAGAAGGGSGASGFASAFASGAVGNADGNAFRNGNVLPFANGGVLGGPTLFPLGLAGESGPEAILPLKRGPNGQLGVQSQEPMRRPGGNPFINRSVSPGASGAPTATELNQGTNRTTNVQMNIRTPDANSFRKSSRQITDLALRSVQVST